MKRMMKRMMEVMVCREVDRPDSSAYANAQGVPPSSPSAIVLLMLFYWYLCLCASAFVPH